MQITVLGAGAGGTAVAFDCASHGHDVRVFDFEQFPDNIATIAEQLAKVGQRIEGSEDQGNSYTMDSRQAARRAHDHP